MDILLKSFDDKNIKVLIGRLIELENFLIMRMKLYIIFTIITFLKKISKK